MKINETEKHLIYAVQRILNITPALGIRAAVDAVAGFYQINVIEVRQTWDKWTGYSADWGCVDSPAVSYLQCYHNGKYEDVQ